MPEPKRKRAHAAPPPNPSPVIYVRNATPQTVASLDAWVAERRAEINAAATDTATRRIAASFSRNDLVLDIIATALARREAAKAAKGNRPA